MAAGLAALGHDGRGSGALDHAGQAHRGADRYDLDPCGHPSLHVLGGVAGTGDHDGHLLVDDHLGHLVGKRAHEHHVHAEGFIGFGAKLVDLVAEPFGVRVHGSDDSQAARLGDGRGKARVGDPGHAALEDGLFDAQKVADGGVEHVSSP